MKPRILISGPRDSRANYENAVLRAGGEPLSVYCPSGDLTADGLLLAGGGDMHPRYFGQPDRGSLEIDPARDKAELQILKRFLAEKKPVLGICRGHQVVHIALGGTLRQDLGPRLNQFHAYDKERDRDRYHPVLVRQDSLLERLYGQRELLVNSAHHQSVDRPGRGMRTVARSESGLLEASEHTGLPVFTVQFHPERLTRPDETLGIPDGDRIFASFVERCRSRAEQTEGGSV